MSAPQCAPLPGVSLRCCWIKPMRGTVGDHNATANCYYFMTDQQPDVVYTMTSGLCGSFQETADDLIKLESVVSDNSAETGEATDTVTDEKTDEE